MNEHASELLKLVKDILCSEMDGNMNKKGHESSEEHQSGTDKECLQDANIVKPTRLKKKESSCRRRRIKSSLKKALAKKIRSNNHPLASLNSLVVLFIKLVYISS